MMLAGWGWRPDLYRDSFCEVGVEAGSLLLVRGVDGPKVLASCFGEGAACADHDAPILFSVHGTDRRYSPTLSASAGYRP
jgi:hypothetical protein